MGAPADDVELLRFDYGETGQAIRQLIDIRFRLLATVPAIAGAAVGFLSRAPSPVTQLGVGVIGFAATLGILVYELRNSQLYEAAVYRARFLESRLGLPSRVGAPTGGGVYSERPPTTVRLLGFVQIWHDRGLSLVYGAALGAWAYLVAWGFLGHQHAQHAAGFGAAFGVAVAAVVVYAVNVAETDPDEIGPGEGG